MKEKSPAKINLYLEINGVNDSGYHLLDSLMVFIDIHDWILIEENSHFDLAVLSDDLELSKQNKQDNIIFKTVELMAKKFNFLPKIKITLQKNIPVAAGLGGGSSNCATTILMLNKIYQLGLKQGQLIEIGFELGCDVPFFLHKKAAVISGLGEKISNLKIKQENLFLLIVNPKKNLATKIVYKLYDEKYQLNFRNSEKIQKIDKENSLIELIKQRQNHLQKPAIEIIPEIKIIIDEIKKSPGCLLTRMSGSGPTCFGMFKNELDLNNSTKKMVISHPDFYIKKSKIIYNL